jgi:hypothetical protein
MGDASVAVTDGWSPAKCEKVDTLLASIVSVSVWKNKSVEGNRSKRDEGEAHKCLVSSIAGQEHLPPDFFFPDS